MNKAAEPKVTEKTNTLLGRLTYALIDAEQNRMMSSEKAFEKLSKAILFMYCESAEKIFQEEIDEVNEHRLNNMCGISKEELEQQYSAAAKTWKEAGGDIKKYSYSEYLYDMVKVREEILS